MKDIKYEDYLEELLENDLERKILKLIIDNNSYPDILKKLIEGDK